MKTIVERLDEVEGVLKNAGATREICEAVVLNDILDAQSNEIKDLKRRITRLEYVIGPTGGK